MILFSVINFWFRCSNAKQLRILDIPWIKRTIILVHEWRQWEQSTLMCLSPLYSLWVEYGVEQRLPQPQHDKYICYDAVLNVFPLCCLYYVVAHPFHLCYEWLPWTLFNFSLERDCITSDGISTMQKRMRTEWRWRWKNWMTENFSITPRDPMRTKWHGLTSKSEQWLFDSSEKLTETREVSAIPSGFFFSHFMTNSFSRAMEYYCALKWNSFQHLASFRRAR